MKTKACSSSAFFQKGSNLDADSAEKPVEFHL
jgi:hypothetical protein